MVTRQKRRVEASPFNATIFAGLAPGQRRAMPDAIQASGAADAAAGSEGLSAKAARSLGGALRVQQSCVKLVDLAAQQFVTGD